jgi:uncharacterized protein
MVELRFDTLTFRKRENEVVVTLLKLFTTVLPSEEIERIAPYEIQDPHTISFAHNDTDQIATKFSFLMAKYFEQLKTKLTGNQATYIHSNSGIPLIGNVAFGIVYRGSSIIEIKTNTACNLDCVYCSISEGISSRSNDFVVEKEYLVEELQKLLTFIDESVEIHIGVQGEPFLYADMEELITEIQVMGNVHTISIDTNGTLLNENLIDRLAKNDKLQLNLSLDAIDEEKAKKIAGVQHYNATHVQKIIRYAAKKLKVIVAPVFTQGWNEKELEKIILFIKSLPVQPMLGIQNFLKYKTGRNAGKELAWKDFYKLIDILEKKHDIKLKLTKEDFDIKKTKVLPKPFERGDVVTGVIKARGRFPGSVLVTAGERNITISDCPYKKEKQVRVEIVRSKHNVFMGKLGKLGK